MVYARLAALVPHRRQAAVKPSNFQGGGSQNNIMGSFHVAQVNRADDAECGVLRVARPSAVGRSNCMNGP
eukprot:706836-Prymnesium_polylepis.1